MKKPSRQIREEIARLQDQLRQAETREAERIGRIALKAGLGEIEIEEAAMLSAFEDAAKRFRDGSHASTGRKGGAGRQTTGGASTTLAAGGAQGGDREA
ncbi:conjugal transfer protein TraC [Chelatococcus asaccharovorans]|uniref:conjugal transfer protein TraC n=1 Tax=Chelatococcus asaccharovorans TaxID=28210 RepID=UPI00224C6667|nr:conjugal transfer protein TraC [Chelatococcus asaccharovorans]CAH1661679.1 Conjugal transfer protein TraC [Chelatococcus asaccharovorans]CAH1689559.1 Conjugal transfer protein TraC [Chelatococcus asaccharovorans]